MRWILFVLFSINLFGADFDCAVIGTSPVSLFEALYRYHSGDRVLILEAAHESGGAWKSIDICGVAHADMGCHEISSSPELNRFLEEYGGCSIISGHTNYYFSQGCFELIDHLLKRIKAACIPLYNDCRVESVQLDQNKKECMLKTKMGTFTSSKIVVTSSTSFAIDGIATQGRGVHKFYHLYLLLQDPTSPRFSYHSGITSGVSRMMNLTLFVGIGSSGRQLIVLQTYSDQQFDQADLIIADLKKTNLIHPEAVLLQAESYVYEQGPYFQIGHLNQSQQSFFEVLNTSHFNVIGNYAPKWKTKLPPYVEGLP